MAHKMENPAHKPRGSRPEQCVGVVRLALTPGRQLSNTITPDRLAAPVSRFQQPREATPVNSRKSPHFYHLFIICTCPATTSVNTKKIYI